MRECFPLTHRHTDTHTHTQKSLFPLYLAMVDEPSRSAFPLDSHFVKSDTGYGSIHLHYILQGSPSSFSTDSALLLLVLWSLIEHSPPFLSPRPTKNSTPTHSRGKKKLALKREEEKKANCKKRPSLKLQLRVRNVFPLPSPSYFHAVRVAIVCFCAVDSLSLSTLSLLIFPPLPLSLLPCAAPSSSPFPSSKLPPTPSLPQPPTAELICSWLSDWRPSCWGNRVSCSKDDRSRKGQS